MTKQTQKRNTLTDSVAQELVKVAKISRLAAQGQDLVNKRRDSVTAFVMTMARDVYENFDISEDYDTAKVQVFNVLRDACDLIDPADLKERKRKEPQYGIVAGDELPTGNLLSAWQMVCHGITLGVDPTEPGAQDDEEFISYRAYRKAVEVAKEKHTRENMKEDKLARLEAMEALEQALRQIRKSADKLDIEALNASRNVLQSAKAAMDSYKKSPAKLRNLLTAAAKKAA